jgi:ubiquinone biosynthesis accessory factor UbiJ
MLHSLQSALDGLVAPALAERLTLLINHVLAAEPVATERLRPHAGATLSLALQGWPALLPAPPVLAWRVTPAGLLDWAGPGPAPAAPELAVKIDASNPALLLGRALAGEVPRVQIEGQAQLAGDVNWLLENLRWDVASDLERFFGPAMAAPLHQLGRMLARAIAAAASAAQGLAALGEQVRARRA